MDLWIPDKAGHDAIGKLPESVALNLIPHDGELPDAILDAEFLVAPSGDPRLHELLRQMSGLRVIQTLSAGVDWLLPVAPPGVMICDAGGTRNAAVAEWVLAAILASTRSLGELRDRQREHRWEWRQSRELAGSTVMILGYGAIGAAVEARLAPFDVEVTRVARHARAGVHSVDELGELLALVEIVVVTLPLTPATTGLLDADLLGRLRPDALLVNAARGPIVDTRALLELLQAGRVRAALDVTDPEPLPADHPLWDAPGVLITPHFAGDTLAADRRAFALAGEQVRRYLRGEPLTNVVEQGY
ncbi:MAG TPA: 2-hydroxyacid dehydrogenase [Solirubrobacteraceae bacterium]|nr:2-hydroxyacid dehydrogenase [Solirubrobacteraceae bacterium]